MSSDKELTELRADISKGICTLLHDRILLLEQYGLINLWLQADGYDVFNAGTVLGYRSDDWETIKRYSGLWRADGRINFEQIRLKRLGIPTIRRRYQGNIYFKFEGNDTSSRSSRNSPAVDSVNESYDNSSPCDQVSWAKIYEYHVEMENGRNCYAKQFPPDLRR